MVDEKPKPWVLGEDVIPGHMIGALRRYIDHGIEPGSFLTAVLSNDLMGAAGRADHANWRLLGVYAAYLHNMCPSGCYGSPESVAAWVKARRES